MRELPRRLVDLLQRHRFALLWLGCAGVVLTAWIRVYALGAFPYFLGDLLINYADGPARRGLTGQLALWLAGLFGGSAVFWALVLASATAVALFALTIRLYRRLPDDASWLLFVLAPFGLLFLAYDPNGSVRKEVFGYLSVLLVLQAGLASNRDRARVWGVVGAAAYLASLLAHEAMILLWPAIAAAYWLMQRRWPALRRLALWLAALTALAGLVIVTVLVLLPRPDPQTICDAAGLDRCTGAFGWLQRDVSDAVSYVLNRRNARDLPVFAVYGLLSLLPFLALRWQRRSVAAQVAVIAVSLTGVAPLFLIGFDWGRWLHMAFFPLSVVCVAAAIAGDVRWRRPVPALLIVLNVGSWSIPHAIATPNSMGLAIWPALGLIHFGTGRRQRRADPSG